MKQKEGTQQEHEQLQNPQYRHEIKDYFSLEKEMIRRSRKIIH